MKFLKLFAIGLMSLFAIFVLWMNLTPGHFHYTECQQSFEYSSVKVNEKFDIYDVEHCPLISLSAKRIFFEFTVLLSNLDFNK